LKMKDRHAGKSCNGTGSHQDLRMQSQFRLDGSD
jgi:hypothetical protein